MKMYIADVRNNEITHGVNIVKLMKVIQTAISFNYVILKNIEGIGERIIEIDELTEKNTVFEKDTSYEILEELDFEWAEIYLFREYPVAWVDPKIIKDYLSRLKLCDVLVRVADGYLISVYSTDKIVSSVIKANNYFVDGIEQYEVENLPYSKF
jgi:hypothetical protein